MKREAELLIKGANAEVIKILREFDEFMNSEPGDTVTVNTGKEIFTRKATLQDTIDFMQNEWYNAKEQLNELGIEVENIEDPKEISNNHQKVHDELVEYMLKAANEDEISYLEYNNIQISFENVSIEKDRLGSLITLYRDEWHKGDFKEKGVASILLKKDVEYIVEDKTGTGYHPLLIENKLE